MKFLKTTSLGSNSTASRKEKRVKFPRVVHIPVLGQVLGIFFPRLFKFLTKYQVIG